MFSFNYSLDFKVFEYNLALLIRHLYAQDLLTRHKVLVAEHLEQNYDAVSDLVIFLLFNPSKFYCGLVYIINEITCTFSRVMLEF